MARSGGCAAFTISIRDHRRPLELAAAANVGLIGSLQGSAVMSMPEIGRLLDSDCPYCLLPREIIAVRFSLKRCSALFVCPSRHERPAVAGCAF
jgi:hypothetical protein